MRVTDFDYELPGERIAQRPAGRGESRLLVADAPAGERHRAFVELPELLRPGDLLVVNDTRVLRARLAAWREPGGGEVELLLAERLAPDLWDCLARPGKRARSGTRLRLDENLFADVVELGADGRRRVRFSEPIEPHLERIGHVPLPPYIDRPDEPADRERYQTVWAAAPGAIAAPTAGLHFTPAILDELERRGVERVAITLHVGVGTFKPMTADLVHEHVMDAERYVVPAAAAATVRRARAEGRRVVAVGTTVVRALESTAQATGAVEAGRGATSLFVTPGFEYRVVDVLLTNFHLPRSTLLLLVAAFAGGRERILALYREAIAHGYRFYSYGDAMLIERRSSR